VGNRVRAKIVKNKVAPPFRTAEFDIMFNQGISKMGDLLDLGVSNEIIKKAGAFYSHGEVRLGQGRENAKEFLSQHPEHANEIEASIRKGRLSSDANASAVAVAVAVIDEPEDEEELEEQELQI
jgi:recombination protein RecA